MFILAAVFLTTCQTVFSEMPCPQSLPARQTHRNSGPLSIPAAVNHASSVSFTQFGTGTVRMYLPLPTRSTMAQRSSRRCKLSKVSSASSRRRSPQPSRMARIARLRFPVGVWPSGNCQSADASTAISQLPKREPSLRTPLTRWIPAASRGSHPSVGCLVSQPAHSCQSNVDCSRSEAALLQMKPITQNYCFVECQSRLRTIPSNELVNSMLISPPRIRRTEASEDCGFGVLQIRYAEFSLRSVLLAFGSTCRRLPHGSRPSTAVDHEVKRVIANYVHTNLRRRFVSHSSLGAATELSP